MRNEINVNRNSICCFDLSERKSRICQISMDIFGYGIIKQILFILFKSQLKLQKCENLIHQTAIKLFIENLSCL